MTHAAHAPAELAEAQRVGRMPGSDTPDRAVPGSPFGVVSAAAMLHLQRTAGNRAAAGLIASGPVGPQRPGAPSRSSAERLAEIQRATDEQLVQRLGLGFLADLVSGAGSDLGGGDATELQQKSDSAGATCAEEPSFATDAPVPVTINADTAIEFVQKIAGVMGNPHMSPGFSWDPTVDERGKVTKVNMTVTTNIIRPRWGMGRASSEEIALIRKAENLIKEHEQRHAAIAKEFGRKAVCAALGKTSGAAKAAIETTMCAMNKAQEALDGKEGMLTFTLDAGKTKVVDVGLGPTKASYPCT